MPHDTEAVIEFSHARQAAWWRNVSRKLTAKRSHLCIFSSTSFPVTERFDRGIQTIELRKIVGSVNRRDHGQHYIEASVIELYSPSWNSSEPERYGLLWEDRTFFQSRFLVQTSQ